MAIERRPAAYAALADVRLATGDARGAEAALRAAVAAEPESIEARVALARFLATAERNAEAEREFLQAVTAAPSSEVANRAAASFYLATGRDEAAERFLKAAAAQPKQTLNSTLALADYYAEARRYQEARAVLEPLAGGPSANEARVRLAAIELEEGSPVAARRLLDPAMKHPTAAALALNAQMLREKGRPTRR